MIDPASQQAIQKIGGDSIGQTPSQPSTVSAEESTSFRDMVGGTSEVNNTQSVQPTNANEGAAQSSDVKPATDSTQSLGDRILQGLEKTQNDIQGAKDKIVSDIDANSQIGQMYNLQLQVGQLATSQQVMGQVGSKTSQGIQTLLKGQ